ncbi:ciliogenesis-associated TTC17-interacting protein-like [Homalodisca vitripennis]|uniref:ciliogenesis-associated TTC17-interacting protein-like n=1 Tax=Homalodisca vitripennis TaxID=197043 RepID=UPI001EEAF37C|nr:ciliogenesis-associated TTC17-interacting protein-like [Homalodisca vitripennis]
MNKTHLDSELGNIDDTKLYVMPRNDTKIAFEEILDLVDEEGRQVDTLTVAVEMGELDTFSVYQYSNDQGIMMRVQSRVLRSLDTEWEVRHLRRPGSSKMLRISVSDKKYRLFKSVQGKDANREKINIKKVPHVRMILEGANIILLRKLAVSRSFGRFKCQTVNHDGEVCECEYVVERGANLDVRVRRTLRDREIMTTTLSKTGRIILHAWSTTGYTLRSRDSGTSTAARLAEEERIALGESELKADVEAYFKKKAEVTNQINEYLLGQPEVKDMIADFLKELLIEKPEDVVSFADDYFSEFVGIVREPVKNEEPLLPSSEGVYRQPTNEDVQ